MKIGDLVKYACPETGLTRMGHIVDHIEESTGFYMYEVICTDPYDRGWFSDLHLEVISEQ